MNDLSRFERRMCSKLLSLTVLACAVHAGLGAAQEQTQPPEAASPDTSKADTSKAEASKADTSKAASPDTSKWECADCPADTGTSGYIDGGVIGVSGSDEWYGPYSGLKHDGGYLQVDGTVRYRGSDAEYFDLDASRFNLDGERIGALAPSLSAEGGKQGLIELNASYQEIPHYPYPDALTPFLGVGGSVLTLPSNWVAASSTAQMSALPQSLKKLAIREKRQVADVGGRFLPHETHWTFDVNYRHDKQSGDQVTGANFLTTTSLLATPVSFATDQVDAGAQYVRDNWQIRLGYYGSFFHDADSAVTWDNPFTPFVPGATVGQMSTTPDNSFNQFNISGAWQILPSTRLMASFAYGEAAQNQSYIGSTVNTDLTQPLPRSSLDGRIDVGNYTVRLTSKPFDRVSITADYVDDRRDNKTAQAAYPQVVTDVYVASTLLNLPYSFDRATARFLADFAMGSAIKLELGAKGEHYDTTFQDVARTVTSGGWLELHTTLSSKFGASFKYDRSRRTIDEYQTTPTIIAVENPLLERFDLANRTRDELLGTVYYVPVQTITLGLSAERHKDNYDRSEVGLTGARDYSLTLNGTWSPSQDASLEAYATHQIISADQAGSQSFGPADWFAHTADEVNSGGITGQLKNITPKLGIGANLYAAYTREAISVDVGSPAIPGFPNNTFRDVGLRLFATYQFTTRSSLRFDYWHERYRTQDWALDGVAPATIVNALTLGIASPNFTVDQLAISYRYSF